jgi:hypothetical protein
LKKLFENINKVSFDDSLKILSMFSGAKEEIKFTVPIDPTVKNVEFWMGDLEDQMFASVKREFGSSVEDYLKDDRIEWIKTHPA